MRARQGLTALWIIGIWLTTLSTATAQTDPDEPRLEQADDAATDDDQPVELGQERTAVGAFLGYDFDEIDEFFIGADLRLTYDLSDVIPGFSLVGNPALNIYFVSGGSLIQLDANILARLDLGTPVTPYAGLGLVIARWSDDFASDTSLSVNPLIAGGDFEVTDSLGGFAQLRATRHSFGEPGFLFSFTTLALMGGLNFHF